MVFKCKMCGGDITPIGPNIGKCEFCKSVMTLPNIENEKLVNLYNRANTLRMNNDFDKAKTTYEHILEIDNKQLEAYWGLLLCKYGVEYIDDPQTKTKIPTCHRTLTSSIFIDSDFKMIQKEAFGDALDLYKKEAKKIDEIQKGILAISLNEDPYDIFICYKETDNNGDRTYDSVLAEDIYHKLIEQGYKVFFSRITLEDKLGTEYEPYIYSALNSSQIMLVVGAKKEHFDAVWVKNEWSRYLEIMKSHKEKTLIPVYSKININKLPEEFSMLQAQNMDKLGATQDLINGINKIISSHKKSKIKITDDEVMERFKKMIEEEKRKEEIEKKYDITLLVPKTNKTYSISTLSLTILISILLISSCFLPFFHNQIWFPLIHPLTYKFLFFKLQIVVGMLTLIAFILGIISLACNKFSKMLYLLIIGIEMIFLIDTWNKNLRLSYLFFLIFILEIVLFLLKPNWNLEKKNVSVTGYEKEIYEKRNQRNMDKYLNIPPNKKSIRRLIYVSSSLLTISVIGCNLLPLKTQSNLENEQANQIQILEDAIRIRDKDGFNSNQIGIAYPKEIYTILGVSIKENYTWYHIKTENGLEGFICGKDGNRYYVSIVGKLISESTDQSNERNTKVKQLMIMNDYINIRDRPSVHKQILGEVYKNEIFTILSEEYNENATWYKIKTKFGIEGYISNGKDNNYIKILEVK